MNEKTMLIIFSFFLGLVLFLSLGISPELNTLNDSSSSKNLTFTTSENKTVYIRIPKYANVTSAYLNLSGLNVGLNAVNSAEIGPYVYSSPAIADGYVYVAGGYPDYYFYQLNATDLSVVNSYKTGDHVFSSPAVANGYVYFGCFDDKVYQLNATDLSFVASYTTGNEFSFGIWSSPTVANGYVYIGSTDDHMYQLNASNVSILVNSYDLPSTPPGNICRGTPTVVNGYVYFGVEDEPYAFYQLNATDLSLVASYTFPTPGGVEWHAPPVADGYVYVGTLSGYVYQFNASDVSQVINNYSTGNRIDYSITVAYGYLYFGDQENVYQLNATDLSLVNSYTTEVDVNSFAVADGYVFVGGYNATNNKTYMLNATDLSLVDSSTVPTVSSPAIANGYVYVGGIDKLYQFNLGYESGSMEWPMFHNYLNHTGYSDVKFDPYPENPYLDVGGDGDTEWSYSGKFNHTNNRTSDFSSEIDDYLSTCTADSENNCNVPLVLHSDTVGIIQINDINITWEDTISPLYRNHGQSQSQLTEESNELYAEGYDFWGLDYAWLATNETGDWENKSAYGSPKDMNDTTTWTWSNFTWSNTSVPDGSVIGWKIYYNDTSGNENVTGTMTFTKVLLKILAVPLRWQNTQVAFDSVVNTQIGFFINDTPLNACSEKVYIQKLNVNTQNFENWTCSYNDSGIGLIKPFVESLGINPTNYDFIGGFVEYAPCYATGYSNGEDTFWVETGYNLNSIAAHEIGHLYGLSDEYCSNLAGSINCECNDCGAFIPQCFLWPDINFLDPELGCNGTEGGGCCEAEAGLPNCEDLRDRGYDICCRGNNNSKGGIATMSFADAEVVYGGQRGYDNHSKAYLSTKLKCEGEGSLEPIIDVNLIVYQNDSVEEEWIFLREGERTEYHQTGNYSLRVLDNESSVLWNQTLSMYFGYNGPVRFGVNYSNLSYITDVLSFKIPYNSSMYELKLYHGNESIYSKILNFCNNNSICDITENYLTCPNDCPLNETDGICVAEEDGIIDPDCAPGVDPDYPPIINILSPQNTTYSTSSVNLTFTVNKPTSWIGYSLDDQENVTITGNTTLTNLTDGAHNVIVYANDTSDNWNASEIYSFVTT